MVVETTVTMIDPRSTLLDSHVFSNSETMYPPSKTRTITPRGAYLDSCVVVV